MADPKTDDFRLEFDGNRLVVVFTPTGASYTFPAAQAEPTEPQAEQGHQADTGGYAEADVRKMAIALARLAHEHPTDPSA
ncbi:hypothetical protein D8770_26690 [Methylobacterium sp. DB1607]|nr:hypothetical protein [Methylobacterium sp. DB1607]